MSERHLYSVSCSEDLPNRPVDQTGSDQKFSELIDVNSRAYGLIQAAMDDTDDFCTRKKFRELFTASSVRGVFDQEEPLYVGSIETTNIADEARRFKPVVLVDRAKVKREAQLFKTHLLDTDMYSVNFDTVEAAHKFHDYRCLGALFLEAYSLVDFGVKNYDITEYIGTEQRAVESVGNFFRAHPNAIRSTANEYPELEYNLSLIHI